MNAQQMSARHVLSSVTRIAPFDRMAFTVEMWPRQDWASGDYVVGEVIEATGPLRFIELTSGRMAEPYNGAAAIRALAAHLRLTVLCASDPYAVSGVIDAFEQRPDLVAGGAANTEAGSALVARLTGLEALNLMNESLPRVRAILQEKLGYGLAQGARLESA